MSLKVENLPKNSLAYSNAVYLNPAAIAQFKESRTTDPESSADNDPKLLLSIGKAHEYYYCITTTTN